MPLTALWNVISSNRIKATLGKASSTATGKTKAQRVFSTRFIFPWMGSLGEIALLGPQCLHDVNL